MQVIGQIKKTREYLDYLEEHINNVQKAWIEIQEKCNDMFFIQDDSYYENIGSEVQKHDLSKMSENEFVQYRKGFFPTDNEPKYDMSITWEHHKQHNPHHWENWTKQYTHTTNHWVIHCVCMIIDWMAMGYKFGDTAEEYYEKNKKKIQLPDESIKLIYDIFKRFQE